MQSSSLDVFGECIILLCVCWNVSLTYECDGDGRCEIRHSSIDSARDLLHRIDYLRPYRPGCGWADAVGGGHRGGDQRSGEATNNEITKEQNKERMELTNRRE